MTTVTSTSDERTANNVMRHLHKTNFTVTGSIAGPGGKDKMNLVEATLDSIEVTFTKLGAVVSGQLAWNIAGDEAGDAEPLLGRECAAEWVLTDGGQGDMLKDGG